MGGLLIYINQPVQYLAFHYNQTFPQQLYKLNQS